MARFTPQEVVHTILQEASRALKRDKHHAPLLFVFGEYKNAMVRLKFRDPPSKRASILATGRRLAFLKPYCIAFVAEAWMSKTIPPEGKSVSEMADRQEVLQAVAQNLEGEIRAAAIPFSRVGKEIVLGELMESSEVESYLLESFWAGVRQRLN